MALKTYVSPGVFDDHVGSSAILGTTANITFAGISSLGFTAPNLTNQANGCWLAIASAPSVSNSGNLIVELLESGVVKASATINYADIQLGMNYVRFGTPYTFATLTASAYTIRVRNSVNAGSLGQLRLHSTNLWFQCTYNTGTALGATDDVWVGGFHNAGMTTKTWTISGLLTSFGSAAATGIGSVTQTMGAALTIGAGATVLADPSASVTLNIKGSIWAGSPTAVFDFRQPTKSIINTIVIYGVANGDQGIFTATTGYGGRILLTGATYDQYSTYASGLGTAASPMIMNIAWDAAVGDEVVIGGGTDYLKNEVRYIKTRNSSTSFVLSSTPGGAEAALVNTHAAGSHVANLTRNVIVKPLVTTRGYYLLNPSVLVSDFSYVRFEYSDCSSGKALAFNNGSNSPFDGIVLYHNSIAGRGCVLENTTTAQTHSKITLYNTQGSNFSGQSGVNLSSANNKIYNDILQFNAPGTAQSCAMISLSASSTGNVFNNCHSYGGNAVNSSAGYVIGIFSSSGNTFNNCGVHSARQNATYFAVGSSNTFNNCNFGNKGVNGNDVMALTGTLNTGFFNACNFGSAVLFNNYLNQLDGSLISFQDMDGNTSKHRWYTNKGSFVSSGSGLADTTVRTAGSLSLAIKPENNTTGAELVFKIPANPASQVNVFGYLYRNAAFSSGTLKVELFLPGTLLTSTPDATVTLPTTTLAWLPWTLNAYYAGSVARYATVRVTAITNTAGAYAFLDDLYDAGTGNKVAGLDVWDGGQISEIMVQSDFSVVPASVWAFADSPTNPNTMGQRLVNAANDAELGAIT
jgi:hypothetical protein